MACPWRLFSFGHVKTTRAGWEWFDTEMCDGVFFFSAIENMNEGGFRSCETLMGLKNGAEKTFKHTRESGCRCCSGHYRGPGRCGDNFDNRKVSVVNIRNKIRGSCAKFSSTWEIRPKRIENDNRWVSLRQNISYFGRDLFSADWKIYATSISGGEHLWAWD